MLWLRLFWWVVWRGFVWGTILGGVVGAVVVLFAGAIYGIYYGAIMGLLVGALNGILLCLVTWMYSDLPTNENAFKHAVQAVGILVNIVGSFAVASLLFGLMGFAFVPAVIAGITAYVLSGKFVKYAIEQMRAAQHRSVAKKSHLTPSV